MFKRIMNSLVEARQRRADYEIAQYIKTEYKTDMSHTDIVRALRKGNKPWV